MAVMERGIAVFDTAVAGLGGCPYAKGASGNVGTEDVIYLMNGLGIEHGVDLDAIAKAGREICVALGREPASKVAQALKAKAGGMTSTRPTLYGSRHAVSAGHYLAAAAGFAILEAGGNAIDAGCAAALRWPCCIPTRSTWPAWRRS